MSLRGIRKQLYRTPHQLFGTKSADDTMVKQWEHDLTTAVAGIDFLNQEHSKWSKHWVSYLTKVVDIVETYRDIHSSLKTEGRKKSASSMWASHKDKSIYDVDNEDTLTDSDGDEQLTKITMYELNQASKMARILLREVEATTKDSSESFKRQCEDMVSILKAALKLLTKRNHKRMDLDMQQKKVDGLANVKLDSKNIEKDSANFELHSEKLNDVDLIFQDIDQKVKAIVPQVLSSLSEFMYKMTMKLHYTQKAIQQLISRNLSKFVRSQGLVTGSPDYETIVEEFISSRANASEKLESLELLKEFREFREKNLREKTVKGVNSVAGSVVDTTVNLSSTIYTKTTKPGQKVNLSLTDAPSLHNPVRLSDRNGMFAGSTDPIEFLKTNSAMKTLSSSARDGGTLSLSQFPSDSPDEHVNVSAIPEDDITKWMKPLKTKSRKERELPPLPSDDPATPRSANGAPSLPSASDVSSAVNDKSSETFKVANVSMFKIRHQIEGVIRSPNIDHCPITAIRGIDVDEALKNHVTARSSIAAQLI